MVLRRILFLASFLPAVVIAAPAGEAQIVLHDGSGQQRIGLTSQRKLHGRFLHITDFHPDEFYKVHTSTEANLACHRGKGLAGTYGAETSDCDAPISLMNATLDWVQANLKDSIDFVIWTGDSARHDSDETIPRNEKQVIRTNRLLSDKFVSTFSDSDGLVVPVVPNFGNNDVLPHNVMEAGPNKWLKLYTSIWKSFIPEVQKHSFQFGGWFYTEVIPGKLAVFSLNTLYFFERNGAVYDCALPSEPGFKQMEWLRVQLQLLRSREMKAILMGHVPPARTASKDNWDETCWQKYTLWLQQYRDVVVGSIYGHMNIDHFMLQDTHDINLRVFRKGTGELNDHKKALKRRKRGNDHVHTAGGANYLVELRNKWAELPDAAARVQYEDDLDTDRKKHKKSKKDKNDLGGDWAERFQLSLVGPSVVPNYFPTLRVFEYNITGLENTPTWQEVERSNKAGKREQTMPMTVLEEGEQNSLEEYDVEFTAEGKKHKKKKGGKGRKEKDPYLTIPDPPAATAPPGPAYSPQTLTLTGFQQYFANLTYINNDAHDSVEAKDNGPEDDMYADKWDPGMHKGKRPAHKPKPREFAYEIEYSTFDDKIYRLKDLTVRSWVKLAYRIGQVSAKTKEFAEDFENAQVEDVEESRDEDEDVDEETEVSDDDVESESKEKKKGHKKKKGKKHKKHNKVWLHFLRHAFVSTQSKKDLKNLDR